MVDPALPRMTVPPYRVTMSGLAHQADVERLGHAITSFVDTFSRYIDLSGLDGITVSEDYAAALRNLDRGYKSAKVPEASSGTVVGCAMTPRVIRDGVLKSHIVISVEFIVALMLPEHELYQNALYVLAHECAHVAVTQAYENAFPKVLLRKPLADYSNLQDRCDALVLVPAWEEYAANRMSAGFRYGNLIDQAAEILLTSIDESRSKADLEITLYREHRDLQRVYDQVSAIYGNLLVRASYLIGTVAAVDRIDEGSEWLKGLRETWFWPHLSKLEQVYDSLWRSFGKWKSASEFDPLAEVLHEVIADGGIHVTKINDTDLWLDIP